MFTNSSRFINWIVASSADPAKVSLSVKALLLGVIPFVFQFLPFIGIHPSITSGDFIDAASGVIQALLTIVALVMGAYGLLRKLVNGVFTNALP